MSCDSLPDDSPYYTRFLDPREMQKISRAVSKRRIEFLYARICAKYALAQLIGSDTFDRHVCVLNDCMGAPHFENTGAYLLSITHGDGLAAAVVCDRTMTAMGVDVQKVNEKSAATIRDFLHGTEKEFYNANAAEYGGNFLATAIWVAKEAMSKLLGLGFSAYSVLTIGVIRRKNGVIYMEFAHLKNFFVRIVPFEDCLFGFALYQKNMDDFEPGIIEKLTLDEVLSKAAVEMR